MINSCYPGVGRQDAEGPAYSRDGIHQAARGAFADYLTGRWAEHLPVEQVVCWNRWGATRERA
jgi:hypothetical protein